ncbi:MAG TPA: glycosyltransferase family 4 protein [Alphaproteobacteria bacterium]|nr:glycosyltransferase family 4 protein [Alphaproteobacteria bacterium]
MKPTILMINRIYPPERGATGRMMQDLAQALERAGWRVSILTTAQKQETRKNGGVTIHQVRSAKNPKTVVGCLVNLWRLYRAAQKISAHDVVLSMSDPQMLVIFSGIIAKKHKAHHIHWAQDIYPDLFKPLGVKLPEFILRALHKRVVHDMNKCSKVVTIGRCMAGHLKKTGVLVNKINLIPNWADFEIISPSAQNTNINQISLPTGVAKRPEEMFRDTSPKFRVLYAGNLGRAHSAVTIVDAAELLAERTEIEFVFVGDHHEHSKIARERTRRGLENIKFMPYQPIEQLRMIMESGDVHLVTMRQSTKGMLVPCKFYSALTVGRPTIYIGPDETEISQVITEYGAGICVPNRDAKALADAIYAYRMDGEMWFQAQEGALRAAQTYHPTQSLHKWVELVNQFRVS